MENIKWAVLGTGVIANEMAQTLAKNGRRIYSVANRTYQKAVDFAKKYNILVVHDNAYSEIEYDGRRGFSFVSLLDSAFSTTCSEAVSEEFCTLST